MKILNELKLFAKNLNILIVEDSYDLNNELVEISKLFFKKVDFAYDGASALEIYKKTKYDIVFTDINMPKLNGVSLCKEIKKINDEQNILILTASDDFDLILELINLGIHQFVSKPFKEEQILYKLLKISEQITSKNIYSKKINFKKVNEKIKNDISEFNNFYNVIDHKIINAKDFYEKFYKDLGSSEKVDNYIESLIVLEKKFDQQIRKIYLYKINQEIIREISNILIEISTKLLLVTEFYSFSKTINNFGEFLNSLDFFKLRVEELDQLRVLEFIYDDISRFIHTVFIYKSSIDINYLQNSLKSSIEQIVKEILHENLNEIELELFHI